LGPWLSESIRDIKSDQVQRALPQSDFGKAIGSMNNPWTSLQRYFSDGRIPIDQNQSVRKDRIAENKRV